jgi:hypothetical protein
MGKHLPSVIWALRFDGKSYVRTDSPNSLLIKIDQEAFIVSRRDARMLARRINQCLDKTTSRKRTP